MRFLKSLIAGLLLVALAPVAGAEAAAGVHSAAAAVASGKPVPKAEFGAGPASAKKVDGRPYFIYLASPGGYVEDHIAVINFATRAQTLNVYPVDAVSGTNGLFAYAPQSAKRKQVGAWLSVGHVPSGTVTLRPRSAVILPVFLHVPHNASPGDHAGAVIVSLTSLVKNKKNTKVKLEQRIATRVIIRVSGPLHPRLSIQNLRGTYSGHLNPFASGVVHLSYTVGNTGNALLGGSQQVSGHALLGSTGRTTAVPGVPLLLPGGAYKVTTHVSDVFPEIEVTATVKLVPEGLRGDVNPGLHVITASVTVWTIPWVLIAIVIVIVLGIIALIWRRRRRSPTPGRDSVQQTPEGAKA